MIPSAGQIIFLEYLTNYNLKLIKDYCAVHDNMQSLISALQVNFKILDKEVYEAYEATNLAIQKLKYYRVNCTTIYDDDYPKLLKLINDAPPIIYYRGMLKEIPNVAVVGSRNISQYATKITNQVVDWLNELNFGVVSGLALGIDTIAHQRAIENNQYTIAVLPNSLDNIYPLSNFKLANQILESGGCLISEMTFGINRGNKSFVQRNRIQAALSDVVIPIEMGVKSGTMHTINFAKRYNKKVYLFEPTKMLSELENYTGILHLIKKPHKNQNIFKDKETFFELFSSFQKNLDL